LKKKEPKSSRNTKNQKLLSPKESKEQVQIEKEEIIQVELKRSYNCKCGCKVILEGETYKRKVKDGFELCSGCSK